MVEVKKVKIVSKSDYPQLKKIYKNFEVCEDADMCLAVGGDGTFLEAARKFDGPILPIWSGEKDSLGFHADVSLKDLEKIIEELKLGRYEIEKYRKIRAEYKRKYYDAVNDITITRGENPKTLHCRVYTKFKEYEELLYPWDICGDGINFASWIGSTAYNWKAGGPINYKTDVILVTPLCAYPTPSIITNNTLLIKVTKNEGILQHDGINISKLYAGDCFLVRNSDSFVKMVKLVNYKESFANKLAKLYNFKPILNV